MAGFDEIGEYGVSKKTRITGIQSREQVGQGGQEA